MLRGCLLVATILAVRGVAGLRYELFRDDQDQGEPIPVAIAWHLKKAKSVTIETYYDDESLLAPRYMERLTEALNEKCETAILLIRHPVRRRGLSALPSEEVPSTSRDDRNTRANRFQSETKPSIKSSVYHTDASIALISDEAYFDEYLDSMAIQLGNKQKFVAVLWIPDEDSCRSSDESRRNALTKHLRKIWKARKVLNVLLSIPMAPCLRDHVFRLDAFATGEDGVRGSLKTLKINDAEDTQSLERFHDDLSDMKGSPVTVSMFNRFPTAIDMRSGDVSSRNVEPHYSHFAGADSLTLQILSENMNFSVDLFENTHGYGYRAPNGTLVGTIGNIANGKIDLSMNSIFVKDYDDSHALDFTTSVTGDRVCIIVPRRGKIPRWMNIFRSFQVSVWMWLILVVVGCSVIRYFIDYATRETNRHTFVGGLIESVSTFLGRPTNLPERTAGRIFMGFFLLFGIIVTGILQCNMFGRLSNPSWFKDIDSLEELDASGLPITTSSPNLLSLFNDNDSSVLANLGEKIQILDSPTDRSIARVAERGNVAALGRQHDLMVEIDSTFVNDRGEKLLHIVSDCLATYHLAYAVPNNSYLLPKIDEIIQRSVESGIFRNEYSRINEAIEMEKRSDLMKLEEQRTKSPAFSMQDVQVAFVTLACGLILSTVVFVMEKLGDRVGWKNAGAKSMQSIRRAWKRNK